MVDILKQRLVIGDILCNKLFKKDVLIAFVQFAKIIEDGKEENAF